MDQADLYGYTGLTELPVGSELRIKRGYLDEDPVIELELGGGEWAGSLPFAGCMQDWFVNEHGDEYYGD